MEKSTCGMLVDSKQKRMPVSTMLCFVNRLHSVVRKFDSHTQKTKISWNYINENEFISGGMDKKIYLWDSKSDSRPIEFVNR